MKGIGNEIHKINQKIYMDIIRTFYCMHNIKRDSMDFDSVLRLVQRIYLSRMD